jgi:hypothetical protein
MRLRRLKNETDDLGNLICPVCGKKFSRLVHYIYKIDDMYYCGYDCWMKIKRMREDKPNGRNPNRRGY